MKWLAMGLSTLEEAVLIVVGIILVVLFIFWFFSCIGNALVIKKAGRNFFLGFVPIYNDYVLCEISGTSYFWFALKYGVPFLLGFIEGISSTYDGLDSLAVFSTIGFTIALSASLSNSFGKGMFTTVMLVLFGPITKIYLGISGNYQGAKGCNDVVFHGNGVNKKVNVQYNNTNVNNASVNNHPDYSFCPQCGNAITEFDRFCNKCGREI